MKPPKKEDPYKSQAYLITQHTNLALGTDARACTWKKVPRTLVAADRMFPDPGMTTSLRGLLMKDALFAAQGCGSPKAFFVPYLDGAR